MNYLRKMKKLFTISFIFFAIIKIASAQVNNWTWANQAGGSGAEQGSSIATDKDGNIYVTGQFYSSSISFGSSTLINAGSYDIFVVKYNVSGNVIWAKSIGGAYSEKGLGICTDTCSNIYIIGCFYSPTITIGSTILTNTDNSGSTSDIYICKYDSSGNDIWAKQAGGNNNDLGIKITTDLVGNVLITGEYMSSTISIDGFILTNTGTVNTYDIFIAKYNSSGNALWAISAGGASNDYSDGINTDTTGNILVTGKFASHYITFDSTSFTNSNFGPNLYDIFVVKFDTSGNLLWANIEGGTSSEGGNDICTDSFGNVYVTGSFGSSTLVFGSTTLINSSGLSNFFIFKYGASGNRIWAKSSGSSCSGTSIKIDTSQNILVTGFFYTSINFGSVTLNSMGNNDIFVVKYNSVGNVLWAKSGGSSNDDLSHGISTFTSGIIYIIGDFVNATTFDGVSLTGAGGYDMFIAKLVESNNTGISEKIRENTISLYPNPSSSKFTIQVPPTTRNIQISNSLGQIIEKRVVSNQTELSFEIKETGIYFVQIITDKEIITRKVIICR